MNRAFLERCNEVEATFEMSREKSAPASTVAEGESSETTAARDRAAEIERDRQQGVVYYEAYRTLGRLQTFVWINTKGFQKIMKKCAEMLTTLPHVTTQMRTHPRRYDKRNQLRGSGRELGPEFEKRLEKESFCSGKIEVLAGAQKRSHPPPCLC